MFTLPKNIFYYSILPVLVFNFLMCKKQTPPDTETTSAEKVVSNDNMLPIIHDSVPYLDSLFSAAILDAQNPTPNKISHDLLPIIGNPDLIDTLINDERYVKMVSWENHPSSFPKSGLYNTGSYDVWVTAAPVLKNRCRDFYKTETDPNMRLRQLLGLQPFSVETFFLEVWVKPVDLFRPCPDNGTADTSCGLNLPDSVTDEYRQWFNQIRAVQYNDCADTVFHQYGYPWTQLGYTYDWSPENPSHVGLSEFVITRHTDIYVRAKYTTKAYCMTSD